MENTTRVKLSTPKSKRPLRTFIDDSNPIKKEAISIALKRHEEQVMQNEMNSKIMIEQH